MPRTFLAKERLARRGCVTQTINVWSHGWGRMAGSNEGSTHHEWMRLPLADSEWTTSPHAVAPIGSMRGMVQVAASVALWFAAGRLLDWRWRETASLLELTSRTNGGASDRTRTIPWSE